MTVFVLILLFSGTLAGVVGLIWAAQQKEVKERMPEILSLGGVFLVSAAAVIAAIDTPFGFTTSLAVTMGVMFSILGVIAIGSVIHYGIAAARAKDE